MFQPFVTNPAGNEASVNLVAGQSYYMEAYHLNSWGTGHFNLAVEVPNTDATATHQVYQVDNVTLSAPLQPEVKNFSMTGASQSGTIQLGIVRMAGLKIDYSHYANVTYGCTAAEFKSALE